MTEMVDLFTGDMNYNIPLLDVDGYPVNISYKAGPSMEEEASWVGLGWSLNPGSINRSLRGIPDDFKGDNIKTKVYSKPNWTIRLNLPLMRKLFGYQLTKSNFNLNLSYNNYTNWDIELPVKVSNTNSGNLQDRKDLNSFMRKAAFSSMSRMCGDMMPEMATLFNYATTNEKDRSLMVSLRQNLDGHQNLSNQSFAYRAVAPFSNLEYSNYDFDVEVAFGPATKGYFSSRKIGGQFSIQKLRKTDFEKPSFGNLYHWDKDRSDALLDFSKEREGTYHAGTPYLTFPVATYDLFNVSGQGVGGQFKSFRNGIDVFSQDNNTSVAGSGNLGLEFGQSSDSHFDVSVAATIRQTFSGKWNTDLSKFIEDNTTYENSPDYENSSLRMVGEKVPYDGKFISNQYAASILSPRSGGDLSEPNVTNGFFRNSINQPSQYFTPISLVGSGANCNIKSPSRFKRNILVSYLTNSQRTGFVEPKLISYPQFEAPIYPVGETYLDYSIASPNSSQKSEVQEDSYRKPHHIGEYTITKNDGSKYVYGISAYNTSQKEVTFTSANQGTVVNGRKGVKRFSEQFFTNLVSGVKVDRSDEYYRSTETPAYSHSHLLTAVLSPDYFDIVPKGPGPEDLGTFTHFEYSRLTDSYSWRNPFRKDEAIHSPGLLNANYDDKCSYTEGKKEVWYLRKISGKNRIAIFFLEPREDGLDASGNSQLRLQRLRKISIYDREEFENTSDPINNLPPIKSVWFKYDYSLCPGVENSVNYGSTQNYSNSGKLTLKEIFYTYGFSTKKFSVYQFKYKSSPIAVYNPRLVDRWGNFKPESDNAPNISNFDFPYVTSNKSSADQFAAIWSLEEIKLPSGGTIKVTYEADDYAYVQDKRAAEMFKIEGFGNSVNFSNSNTIYSQNALETGFSTNNYIYVKVPNRGSLSDLSISAIADQMLDVGSIVYFKTLAHLANNQYEWIKTYGKVEEYGVCPTPASGENRYIYIRIQQLKLENNVFAEKLHPITKAGFQLIKDQLPEYINPSLSKIAANDYNIDVKEILFKIFSVSDYFKLLVGTNFILRDREYFNKVDLNNSWVRLSNPEKARIGGGHRVKTVEMSDNWLEISEDPLTKNQSLVQEYQYTTTETIADGQNKINRTISSGVAAYEPGVGSEENPNRLPIQISKYDRVLPDEEKFDDGPLGEGFYPAPVVGYSKVTITSSGTLKDANGVPTAVAKGTSKTIQEFYTALDFPVKVNSSYLYSNEYNFPLIDLFYFSMKRRKLLLTQGFRVELNDMHGKQKATYSYAMKKINNSYSEVLTGYVKNFYKVNEVDPHQLANNVKVVFPDGAISTADVGVENDFYVLTHKQEESVEKGRLDLNSTLLSLPPAFIPAIVPTYSENETNVYITTSTQVINRYGVLEATEANKEGSIIRTENLAYDAFTGEVLANRTYNEFKEPVYSITSPAHWVYNQMGQGSQNIGLELKSCSTNADAVLMHAAKNYLANNDRILIRESNGTELTGFVQKTGGNFILSVQNTDPNQNNYGTYSAYNSKSGFSLAVISSGNENRQSVAVGQYVCLSNPLLTTGLKLGLDQKILDVQVTPYGTMSSVYKEYQSTVSEMDSLFPVGEVVNCLNYLLRNMEISISAQNNGVYEVPDAIFNGDNPVGNSGLVRFQKLNNSKKLILSIGYPNFNSNSADKISLSFSFVLAKQNLIVLEHKIASNVIGNFFGKRIWTFQYGVLNYKTNNHYVASLPDEVNSLVEFKDFESNNFFTSQNNSNSHYYLPNQSFKTNLQLIEDDHLQKARAKLYPSTSILQNLGVYAYKAQRTYPQAAVLAKSGYYQTFNGFNYYNIVSNGLVGWRFKEQTSLIDPYTGNPIENKDELNRYQALGIGSKIRPFWTQNSNAQLVGGSLIIPTTKEFTYTGKPEFVVDNSRHCQSTYFSFENNQQVVSALPSGSSDFHFFYVENYLKDTLSFSNSHTGKSSIAVNTSANFSSLVSESYANSEVLNGFILPFYPEVGNYRLSCWVKPIRSATNSSDIAPSVSALVFDANDKLIHSSFNNTYSVEDYGEWKRIVFDFTIPPGTSKMLKIFLNGGTQGGYFDDLRIHPVAAAMKSYVYNNLQQVVAELDENNFASCYVYNKHSELISVRKETSKGFSTVIESRKAVNHD
ncbi:hypothetical protein MASR2M44_24790 [Bacteroidota bacterium]